MSELETAELQTRLDALGLHSGISTLSRAKMSRVAEKAQRLKKLTTPEQFQLLTSVLRLHKGDLEEKIDALVTEIELGTFHVPLDDPSRQRQSQVRLLANRRQRRRKRSR